MKASKSIMSLCIYSLLLVVLRVYFTKSVFYLFMVWNLFLAIIPYVISNHLKQVNNKYLLFVLFPVWLVFLPNSAYIITDLVHLHQGTLMPIWFDLLLILSFSITGMLLFYISLNDVFLLLKKYFSIKKAWFLIVFVIFLSSFGIYLGRYLRWNSWDIMHRPQLLLNDVFTRIIHPAHHPKTWGITLGFGFLFLFGFLIFRFASEKLFNNKIHH